MTMKKMSKATSILCGCAAGIAAFAGCAQAQTLKQVATIDLPGPRGQRFDYLAIDDEDHFLLSEHLGPGILYVIDLGTNKVVKAIPGLPEITGLEFVPGVHKVYTSNWGEEKIGVVDLSSMSVTKRLPTGAKPNGSTYAAPFRKAYIANALGKAVTVVDVDKDEIVKTLEFASETGMPQYDSSARRVLASPLFWPSPLMTTALTWSLIDSWLSDCAEAFSIARGLPRD